MILLGGCWRYCEPKTCELFSPGSESLMFAFNFNPISDGIRKKDEKLVMQFVGQVASNKNNIYDNLLDLGDPSEG